MSNTATLLGEDIGGYAGLANLYALDPPLRDPSGQGPTGGYSHVVVWVQTLLTPEAVIVPARPDGSAIVMNRLPGSYVHPAADHTWALLMAGGYEVVEPTPEQPANPEQEEAP